MKMIGRLPGNFPVLSAMLLVALSEVPVLAQGDPVRPDVNLTPVNTSPTVPQGPNFFQTIQQQQQIQNQIQNMMFPPYLQANPTISPLDQRSGLTNNSTKIIILNPVSLGITTVKVPNIINSSLLAPTNTVVTSVPVPTGVIKTPVPSITISPAPILKTSPVPNITITPLPVTTNTSDSEKTKLDSVTKALDGMIDQSIDRLQDATGKFNSIIDDIAKNMDKGKTTATTTTNTTTTSTTSSPSKSTTTGTTSNNVVTTTTTPTKLVTPGLGEGGGGSLKVQAPATTPVATIDIKPSGQDFVSKLTGDFLNFPNLSSPQERENALKEMNTTFTNLQKLGLMPKNALDDLAKFTAIATNPNHPSIKTNDSTTVRFYIQNILVKLSTAYEGSDISNLTTKQINDVANASDPFSQIMQSANKASEGLSNIREVIVSSNKNIVDPVVEMGKAKDKIDLIANKIMAQQDQKVTSSGIKGAITNAAKDVAEAFTSLVAPAAARASAPSAASALKTETKTETKSTPYAPPSAPTVDMTALKTELNTNTNSLGALNTKLESKITSLANVTNSLKNTVPTATNKGQLDMFKAQAQSLQAEIGQLQSQKSMAENNVLTTFSKMYGATAATQLKLQITGNPDAKALSSIVGNYKP